MKKFIFAMTFMFSLSSFAINYDEAENAALENSHDLRILKLQSQAASYGETKAMAGFLPTLELSARHLLTEQFEVLEVPFGGAVFAMPAIQPYTAAGVNARWNLFNGFQSTNALRAARSESAAARSSYDRALDEKRVQIRSLYSRALASQILVQVATQNIESLQSHLNDVGARIRSGISTRYDSLRAEVQLEEARTDKLSAENAVVSSRARLFEAMGIADDGKPLEGELTKDFTKVKLADIQARLQERNDRAALIAQRERADSLSKAAMGRALPAVSLYGNYEWYNNVNHSITEDDQRFRTAYGLGISLTWNLFEGGADYADHQRAILARQIADENVAKFDQSSQVQATEVQNKFNFDLINYNAKLSNVRKAEEAVRLAKGGLRAGTRTNTELLDAVVEMNRARAAAVKSQVEAIEDMGQLELTLGIRL